VDPVGVEKARSGAERHDGVAGTEVGVVADEFYRHAEVGEFLAQQTRREGDTDGVVDEQTVEVHASGCGEGR
jgi:hypothetical protein